jgi:hypothetical protein
VLLELSDTTDHNSTGRGSDLSREEVLRSGVQAVLKKPLRVSMLAATLERCLAGRAD